MNFFVLFTKTRQRIFYKKFEQIISEFMHHELGARFNLTNNLIVDNNKFEGVIFIQNIKTIKQPSSMKSNTIKFISFNTKQKLIT